MKAHVFHLVVSVMAVTSFYIVHPIQPHAEQKVLYFTFDDGPSERYTAKILDILHQENVPATFFVLGFRSEQFPHLVRRMTDEGHEIGNHGFYHERIIGKPDEWVRSDVFRADEVIRKASGVNPVFYRPPGGVIDQREISVIRKTGHPVILWTVDSQDWNTTSVKEIVKNVVSNIQPGAIVLFHDGVSNSRYTVEALPTIIHKCRTQGFAFKVLPTHG